MSAAQRVTTIWIDNRDSKPPSKNIPHRQFPFTSLSVLRFLWRSFCTWRGSTLTMILSPNHSLTFQEAPQICCSWCYEFWSRLIIEFITKVIVDRRSLYDYARAFEVVTCKNELVKDERLAQLIIKFPDHNFQNHKDNFRHFLSETLFRWKSMILKRLLPDIKRAQEITHNKLIIILQNCEYRDCRLDMKFSSPRLLRTLSKIGRR